MGMFDEVLCRYRLPHHQEARFQTKDLAAIALGERCVGGLLDEYAITEDGRLRRHVHEREWVEDPSAVFGGHLKSVRDWWEDVPGAHGDVWIYTTDTADDSAGEEAAGESGAPTDRQRAAGVGAWRAIEFRIRFTNGRVEGVEDLSEPRARDRQVSDAAPLASARADASGEIAQRSTEEQLLASVRASLSSLEALLERANDHWGREDAVYRYYHQSFKVYAIQSLTLAIVTALQEMAPDRPLCAAFSSIVEAGTGKAFSPDDNRRWAATTRPILEAFFHAHYFLEMAVRYGRVLAVPPPVLPSGWAAVLTLYGLR